MGNRFLLGLLFSVLLFVVPAVSLALGVWTSFMLGALIGAAVRFGTDMTLLRMGDTDADDFEQFTTQQMPLVILMMLIQFGTLLGAIGWYIFAGGGMLALGIVAAILASYVFGIVLQGIFGTTTQPTGPPEQREDADEGEWRFDLDDL